MSEWEGVEPEVTYEVWRTGVHRTGKGTDVRIYSNLSEKDGPKMLEVCYADKADGYPDTTIEFYLVRATTTRERVT